tara:strand:+ start:137 stop:979 length:843 start_codon:yes stop_codon:yes gene_type:complete
MFTFELIKSGAKLLKKNNIPTHLLDAELILSNLLNQSRENLLISNEKKLSKKIINRFHKQITRRSKKEPLAYIVNKRDFWKSKFYVNSNTLIPRPETELLVEKIINYYKNSRPFILDIGTGSGCILISILQEVKKGKGIGLDVSKKAIHIAKKNATALSVINRIKFINKPIDFNLMMKFDLVVSNPPYILSGDIKNLSEDIKKYEPIVALDGGKDGLDVLRKVIYKAKDILKIKGMLALEIGHRQYKKVSQILKKYNFREKILIKDFKNNIRCIISVLER